jgi:hypothetical protein
LITLLLEYSFIQGTLDFILKSISIYLQWTTRCMYENALCFIIANNYLTLGTRFATSNLCADKVKYNEVK